MKLCTRILSFAFVFVLLCSQAGLARAATTLIVTSPTDSGPGSLRQALLIAASGDTITFDPAVFPPASPTTILLLTPLPALVLGNLTIDASNAGVILDGSVLPGGSDRGLVLASNGNTVRGLQITRFPYDGILIMYASDNQIGGDRGLGSAPLGQGNLISGNDGHGIQICGDGSFNNQVQGNFIGTNLAGTAAWANGYTGIALQCSLGAHDNIIGGATPGLRNLISGNTQAGIQVREGSHHNTIAGNDIGVNANHSAVLPNGSAGIYIVVNSHDNQIGDPNLSIGASCSGGCNLIRGNSGDGVWVDGVAAVKNLITHNRIYENTGLGINLTNGAQANIAAPTILMSKPHQVAGSACANCKVEIYSDSGGQGRVLEMALIAGSEGNWSFSPFSPFSRPYLTALAIDANNNTSAFSLPRPVMSYTALLPQIMK